MGNIKDRLLGFIRKRRARRLEDDYEVERGKLRSAGDVRRAGQTAAWQMGPYGAGQAPHDPTLIGEAPPPIDEVHRPQDALKS